MVVLDCLINVGAASVVAQVRGQFSLDLRQWLHLTSARTTPDTWKVPSAVKENRLPALVGRNSGARLSVGSVRLLGEWKVGFLLMSRLSLTDSSR
jgi:hypothetical protein